MPAKFSATAERPALPDLNRLQFLAVGEKDQVGSVDVKLGRIAGVSLLTANREASGHGVWIDPKTLETFRAQLSGRRIKAYATHGAWGGDGTLDEVGYWENVRIEGIQLREDFVALDAWRKHEEAEFDTLFELATKMPQEFGASLAFSLTLAWVRKDGTEVPTQRKWRECGGWDYEMYFDPAMPADAERDMPSVRCVEVYSADFVCVPAANDGLFHRGPLDAAPKGISPAFNSTQFVMTKELFAKFGSQPALLTAALKLHTENEKLTFSEIVAKVEGEQTQAELATLRSGKTELEGQLSALKTESKTALDAANAKILKLEAELAAKVTDIATLKAGGTVPINTGAAPAGAGGDVSQLKGLARTEAALKAENLKKSQRN